MANFYLTAFDFLSQIKTETTEHLVTSEIFKLVKIHRFQRNELEYY